MKPRKPWLAALLSLLFPGLGHLYAGQPARALAWGLAGVLAGVLLPLVALVALRGLPAVFVLAATPLVYLSAPAISAKRSATHAPIPFTPTRFNHWAWYLVFWLVFTAIVQVGTLPLLRQRYQAFRMPSGSMAPTLQIGDFFYVKLSAPQENNPANGSVVVFESSEEPGLRIVKRVVGTPGDTLAMIAGELQRNGHPVAEPYSQHVSPGKQESPAYRQKMHDWQVTYLVDSTTPSYDPDVDHWGPLVVPQDSFFVLGDNRDASYDSRYYGWVGRDRLLGRPQLIYYSYDPSGYRPLPAITAVRWKRLGLMYPF